MDRLRDVYRHALPSLANDLGLSNLMAVPKIHKITINLGLGDLRSDSKKIDATSRVLAIVSGQKPSLRRAKKAVSSFKLRAGEPVGLALTLRGQRMYDFLERFIRIILPRVRDFRGIRLSKFDQEGNLTIGVRDLSVFPEIPYEDLGIAKSLEVTIVTAAGSPRAGARLLSALGFPLIKEEIVS